MGRSRTKWLPGRPSRKPAFVERQSKKSLGYFHYLKNLDQGGKIPCLVEVLALEIDDLIEDYPERGQRELE